MSDCLICYDYQAMNGRMIFLECLHGLCQSCLYKLQKSVCPFCRTVIKKDVYTQVSNNDKKQGSNGVEVVRNEVVRIVPISYPRVIRVRVRRHRRIRSIDTDIIDSNYGVINIESPIQIAVREKRKRNKQDNKKKGRYSQSKYRNGQRYRYV